MNVEVPLRVVAWNCSAGRLAEKLEHLSTLAPDVAVVCEATQPKAPIENFTWFGNKPIKGVAVLTSARFRVDALPVSETALWSVRPFRIEGPIAFNLLTVWTHPKPTYVRALSLALDAYGPSLRDRPLVLAGDFNANSIWDKPKGLIDFSRLAARLRSEFGLVSAYHAHFGEPFGRESRPTHYFQYSEHAPFHLDYCFAPAEWRVERVDVQDYQSCADLSDHRPVAVDLRVSLGGSPP
jgi:hypothetical protein